MGPHFVGRFEEKPVSLKTGFSGFALHATIVSLGRRGSYKRSVSTTG